MDAPPAPPLAAPMAAPQPVVPMPPVAAPAASTTPAEPEYACETLYIQNLNEKIKVDSAFYMARTRGRIADHACDDLFILNIQS